MPIAPEVDESTVRDYNYCPDCDRIIPGGKQECPFCLENDNYNGSFYIPSEEYK